MGGGGQEVVDAELEPVVGDLTQAGGNGGVALALDGLAHLHELIPGGVGVGHSHAAGLQHVLVHEQAFPEAVHRHAVVFAVHGGGAQHVVLHVGSVVGVDRADLVDGHNLGSALDEGVGVGAVEEEQHVGLAAGLKVGQNLGLELFVGSGGGVLHGVAGRFLPSRHSVLVVLGVGVGARIGGDHADAGGRGGSRGAVSRLRGRLRSRCAASSTAAGYQRQAHGHGQNKCKCLFHYVYLHFLGRIAAICCVYIISHFPPFFNERTCFLLPKLVKLVEALHALTKVCSRFWWF